MSTTVNAYGTGASDGVPFSSTYLTDGFLARPLWNPAHSEVTELGLPKQDDRRLVRPPVVAALF